MSNSLRPHELQHARQASLSITNSRSSLRLMSIESAMPSSHLILCCPLLLLPQIPPSIRAFSSESTLHMRWPKYWSFSFSIIPSKEIPGLISFRMDWSVCYNQIYIHSFSDFFPHQIRSDLSCPTLCDPMNRSTPGLPVPSPTPRVH